MRLRFLLACASFPALTASAQIELVKDFGLNPVEAFPKDLTASGSLLFFSAHDAATGWELWKSDGTAAGTVMVKDINPGTGSSVLTSSWMTDVDGTIFFAADDGANGVELWKSDGTEPGTVMVEDINPGPDGSNPSFLIHYDIGLLFAANNGSGQGLWKSDGGTAGTDLVVPDFSPYATPPVIMQGIVYFNAYSNTAGNYTLWKTNGTSLLTEVVAEPGAGGPVNCGDLSAAENLVYFTSTSANEGNELWRSDGYSWATAVVDVNPGSSESYVRNITTIGDTAYFHGTNGVDGNGLYRFRPGQAPEHISTVIPLHYGTSRWPYMVALNGTIYFVGYDPTTGAELYKSDGTAGGTVLVRDINPGTNDGLTELSYLKVVGDSLYFLANTTGNGQELWVSDGTEAGTVMVQDRYPGAASFMPMELTQVGNSLFMRGNINDQADQLFRLSLGGGGTGLGTQTVESMQVWPVPSTGALRVSGAPQGAAIRLLDIAGRTVPCTTTRTAQHGATIEIHTTAPAGSYLLVIDGPNVQSSTLRVVIE